MTESKLSRQEVEEKLRQQYAAIIQKPVPRHIAIIMDGNGRWASARHLSRNRGHAAGTRLIRALISRASDIGVDVLTLYCFSTENWRRPLNEVNFLMELIRGYLEREAEDMVTKGVRLMHIGDIEPLPATVREQILTVEKMTKDCTTIVLNIAVNYGGRQEILSAVRALAAKACGGALNPSAIDSEMFAAHLQTATLSDPDLIIRTSGEQRLSNFLLWQSAYSEMYFTDINWPEFTELDLYKAVLEYQRRCRRFGGLSVKKDDRRDK